MMGLPVLDPDRKLIQVKAQYEGQHCWPDAPQEVAFLRTPHRHLFLVEAHIEVKSNNRELEFIMVKRWLEKGPLRELETVGTIEGDKRLEWSCEDMAQFIGVELRNKYGDFGYLAVGVYEDGENGGVVIWDK